MVNKHIDAAKQQQKLPRYLIARLLEGRTQDEVPIGILLPIPTALGAAFGGLLLHDDYERSIWASIPLLVAVASLLVLHDVLLGEARPAQCFGERLPRHELG